MALAEPPPWAQGEGANDDAPLIETRVPPHDLKAEAAILNACMGDVDAMAKAAQLLRPDQYYAEAHRRVFEACVSLHDEGRVVDVVTVHAKLSELGRLEQVGFDYLTKDLPNACPALRGVDSYIEIVLDRWRARQAIRVGQRLTAQGYAGGIDSGALISSAAAELEVLRAPSSALAVVTFDGAAIAEDLPELQYLVREIRLVSGGGAPHLAAGYGYSGKTMALQAMLLGLAAGLKVWGAYPVRPCRVVHVDKEQGRRLTHLRYQRLARPMGIDLCDLGNAINTIIMPPLSLSSTCADDWLRVMDGRDLLLLDSMRAASPGQDENSSDIRAGLDMLGEISERTGCRAIVIHHARKPGDHAPSGRYSIRGSSAIFDALDCAYVFSANKGEPIQVQHEKARSDGELVDDFALVVSDVEIDGNPRAGLRVDVRGAELIAERRAEHAAANLTDRTKRDAEKLRRVIATTPGLGSAELRGAAGLPGDRVALALAHVGDAIEIREEKRGRSVRRRHYLRGGA